MVVIYFNDEYEEYEVEVEEEIKVLLIDFWYNVGGGWGSYYGYYGGYYNN